MRMPLHQGTTSCIAEVLHRNDFVKMLLNTDGTPLSPCRQNATGLACHLTIIKPKELRLLMHKKDLLHQLILCHLNFLGHDEQSFHHIQHSTHPTPLLV